MSIARQVHLGALICIGLIAPSVSAQTVTEMVGHEGPVSAVAFSSDGKTLASSSFDKTVRLWDPTNQQVQKVLTGHADVVLCLGFRPDGRQLASGSRDAVVKVWNIAGDQPIRVSGPLPAAVARMALSPSGEQLAVAGQDGILRILNANTHEMIAEWKAHEGAITVVAWSMDGEHLFTTGPDGTLRGFHFPGGETTGTVEIGSPSAVGLIVLADGSAVITASADGKLTSWRRPLGTSRVLAGHAADVIRVFRAGESLISVGSDQTIHVHHAETGEQTRVISSPAPLTAVAVNPAAPDQIITASEDNALRTWSLADGNILSSRMELPDRITALTTTPNGQTLLWGEAGGAVRALPLPLAYEYQDAPVDAHLAKLTSLDRNDKTGLFVTGSADRTVRLWNPDRSAVRAYALLSPVRKVALSGADDRLAALGEDRVLRVWAINGAELKVIASAGDALAFSPDGKWFAHAIDGNKTAIHPADFSAEPKTIGGHEGPVLAIAFSADSTQIITASADKSIKVTDIASATEVRALAGHQAGVRCLDVSGDGAQLVSGGDDKSVIVWNLADGAQLANHAEAAQPITDVSISPDAQTILATSADGALRVYRGGALRGTTTMAGAVEAQLTASPGEFLVALADNQLHVVHEVAPRVIGHHQAAVHAITVTADGNVAISSGDDKLVRLWETATGQPIRALAHGQPATQIAIDPATHRLITGESAGKIRTWDVATGDPGPTWEVPGPLVSLAVHAGGPVVVVDGQGTVHRTTLDGAPIESFAQPAALSAVPLNETGSVVVVGKGALYSIRPPATLWQASIPAPIHAITPTLDGQIAVASQDALTLVSASGEVTKTIALPASTRLASSPDRSRIVAAGSDMRLRLIDPAAGTILSEYAPAPSAMTGVQWSSDGKAIISAHDDGSVRTWSIATSEMPGAIIAQVNASAPALDVVTLPTDGQYIVANSSSELRTFAPPPPPSLDLAGHKGSVFGVAYSPDGHRLASSSNDESLIVWNVENAQALGTLTGHQGQVYSAAFLPDGKRLVSAGNDRLVIAWDAESMKESARWSGATDALYQLAVRPGGAQVVAGGVGKVLHQWDVDTGSLTRTFEGHPEEIYGVSVRPDGQQIAVAGYGGTVTVWDFESAAVAWKHQLPAAAFSVAFHPDGSKLAVGSADHKIYLLTPPSPANP